MAKKIDTLLNKKTWRGQELGKVLMSSVVHDIKRMREGKPPKPLFNQSDFEMLERNLKNNTDFIAYGVYTDLYSSLIDNFNRAEAEYQQFLQGFHRLLHYLTELQNADKAEYNLTNQPYIFTEKQYKDLKEITKKEKAQYKESYASLFFTILNGAIDHREHTPLEICNLVDSYKETPANNKELIDLYFKHYNIGYYTLPNGKKSTDLSPLEWKEEETNAILNHYNLIINNRPATKEEVLNHYRVQKTTEKNKLLFRGVEGIRESIRNKTGQELEASDEEIKDAIKHLMYFDEISERDTEIKHIVRGLLDYPQISKHNLYTSIEEMGKDLTEYNLIEALIALSVDEERPKKALEEIKKGYPKIYKAVTDYIEEALPQVKELKANQLYTYKYSWKELSEKFSLFKMFMEIDTHDIIQAYKATVDTSIDRQGIAIIKECSPSQIDDKGYYIEPKSPLYYALTLESVVKDLDKLQEIEGIIHRLISPAIAYLYAYNSLIDILQNVYEINELDTLKTNTGIIESQIKGFNGLLHSFYALVTGDEEAQTEKREMIKTIFQEINVEDLKPSKEAIEEVAREIDELGLTEKAKKQFRYLDKFINALLIDTKGAFYE